MFHKKKYYKLVSGHLLMELKIGVMCLSIIGVCFFISVK
jgi:hypothetical protein